MGQQHLDGFCPLVIEGQVHSRERRRGQAFFNGVVKAGNGYVCGNAETAVLQCLQRPERQQITDRHDRLEIHSGAQAAFIKQDLDCFHTRFPAQGAGHQFGQQGDGVCLQGIQIGAVTLLGVIVFLRPPDEGQAPITVILHKVFQQRPHAAIAVQRDCWHALHENTQADGRERLITLVEDVDLRGGNDTAQAGSPGDQPVQAFLPGQVIDDIPLEFKSHLGAQPSPWKTDQVHIIPLSRVDQTRP